MTEPREKQDEQDIAQLLGKAFDIIRYAPIGALLDGPSLVPKLAEQGKVHVRNAEVLGRLVLHQGRDELLRRLEGVSVQAVDFLRMMGLVPTEHPMPPAPARRPESPPAPQADGAVAPPSDDLAIPDYDSLSASQVVNRLPGLSADELEAVRSYESAHRGRKTILNKVAQLA
jgi:hypothetical protein